MSKIKSVSEFNGTSWGTAVPLGADADNIDITSATTAPTDSTATLASLDTSDVIVLSTNSDTGASAWTKFNRFRKRVINNFNNYIANSALLTSYSAGASSAQLYSAEVINNYMANVIGYSGTVAPANGSIMNQLNERRMVTYTSVTQLGLTSGCAPSAAWNAMRGKAACLICNASEFNSTMLPYTAGNIIMCRNDQDASRGFVRFIPRVLLAASSYALAIDINGNISDSKSDWIQECTTLISTVKTINLPANTQNISITATNPDSSIYQTPKFICWYAVAGSGNTTFAYISIPTKQSSTLWTAASTTSARTFNCYALFMV